MKLIPSPVTEDADLRFHAKEGLSIPISFQDETGAPRDMTGHTVNCYIDNGPTIALVAGTTSDQMILNITKGSCNSFIGKMTPFAVVDETDTTPLVVWSGSLMVGGFV